MDLLSSREILLDPPDQVVDPLTQTSLHALSVVPLVLDRLAILLCNSETQSQLVAFGDDLREALDIIVVPRDHADDLAVSPRAPTAGSHHSVVTIALGRPCPAPSVCQRQRYARRHTGWVNMYPQPDLPVPWRGGRILRFGIPPR